MVARIESGINSQLNGELPLGLSHSDFTPPNILIDVQGCVTVIDTLASWRAPVYDDLARLSVGLEFSLPQTASHGLWYPPSFVRQLEQSFWESYFGSDEVNKSAIRVFQCILGLERWVAYHFRHSAANGGNIPGSTRVLSIAIYDHVETLRYAEAHALAAGLLVFSFAVLLLVYAFDRRARVRVG